MKIPFLVNSLHIDERFLDNLVAHGLIPQNNLDKLKEKAGFSSKAFPYKLLEEIDRHPDAFRKLYRFLRDSEQLDAAKILKGERSISGSSTRTTSLSEACSSPETLVSQEEDDDADGFKKNMKTLMKALKMKDQPPNVSSPEEFMVFDSFEVKVIPGTKEYQDKKTYKLSSGLRRGKAMIINFETFEGTDYPPREGSEKDVINLRALFSQLGKYCNHCSSKCLHFCISTHKDLTSLLWTLKIWEVMIFGGQ